MAELRKERKLQFPSHHGVTRRAAAEALGTSLQGIRWKVRTGRLKSVPATIIEKRGYKRRGTNITRRSLDTEKARLAAGEGNYLNGTAHGIENRTKPIYSIGDGHTDNDVIEFWEKTERLTRYRTPIAPVTVDDDDIAMMQAMRAALAKARALHLDDFTVLERPISRPTAVAKLRRLVEKGLVERLRERGGWTLLPKGVALLAQLDND